MVLVRIPQQRLAKQQVNSSQEELFDAPSPRSVSRRTPSSESVPRPQSNAVAAAPTGNITATPNLSATPSAPAIPMGKPAISPQIQVRVNPNIVKPNIIKQAPPAPVSMFSSRPMPISRRGYEVLPLEAAIPSEILRSPGPALYRGRSFKKRQQMAFYKLSRFLKRCLPRRGGGFGRANRSLLPAALGGAGILTILVFISDGPALSLLSDNADSTAAAPQLTDVASQSTAPAEQDLELQIDEDAELFEGGAGGPDAGAVFGETAEKLAALSEPPELPPAVQQQQAQAAIESAKQAVSTVPGTAVPGMDGVQDKELLKRMGKVKFIAGMIAVHRPNVADCGALAKEIVEVSTQKKLDPFFVAAIVSVESRFGVDARSKAGALGLMQLLPETARDVMRSETGRRGYPLLTHSRTNITLGVEYIRNMIARYRGNRFYALAAYNWGPANVDRVGSANGIPRAVRKYAETVLERATSWKRHFESAEKSASSLAQGELARRTLG